MHIANGNSTSDHTLWTLYRSYFKGISANIELQAYKRDEPLTAHSLHPVKVGPDMYHLPDLSTVSVSSTCIMIAICRRVMIRDLDTPLWYSPSHVVSVFVQSSKVNWNWTRQFDNYCEDTDTEQTWYGAWYNTHIRWSDTVIGSGIYASPRSAPDIGQFIHTQSHTLHVINTIKQFRIWSYRK
jgi:hypothetical protein